MIPVAQVPQVAVVESINDVKIATTQNKSSVVKAGYISNYNMNVRSGPGTNYSTIGSIAANTPFMITAYDTTHTWGKEKTTGGWVCLTYAKLYTDDAKYQGTTTANVNMRKGPGTSYAKITTIPKGARVDVYGSEDGWYKVIYDNQEGWVSGEYLNIGASTEPDDFDVMAKASENVRMRKGPGTGYSAITTVPKGSKVYVLDVNDDESWTKIRYNDLTGWCYSKYIVDWVGYTH